MSMYQGEDPGPLEGHGDNTPNAPPAVFHLQKSQDPRITPEPASYVAPTGAASITMVEQKLPSPSTNTMTFTVTPPSAGAVVQKNIMIEGNYVVEFSASSWIPRNNGNPNSTPMGSFVPAGQLFPLWGQDVAIACANPFNRMVSNWQIQMNNMTVQFNNQATDDLVHMRTKPSSRAWEGVTTRTPMYASWDDAWGTNHSLGSMAQLQGRGDVGPGAYEIQWVVPTGWGFIKGWYPNLNGQYSGGWAAVSASQLTAGTPLVSSGVAVPGSPQGNSVVALALSVKQGNPATAPIYVVYDSSAALPPTCNAVGVALGGGYGVPVGIPTKFPNVGPNPVSPPNYTSPSVSDAHTSQYAVQVFMVDTVQCPPWGFSMEEGYVQQGLWGLNSMLITAQLTDPGQARWLQGSSRGGMSSLNYTSWRVNTCSLRFTYLSPSATDLQVLPPRCVVPYPVKQTTTYEDGIVVAAGQFHTATVPSTTFSQVSDFIAISVRPKYSAGAVLPDGQASPTSVPFHEADFCAAFPSQVFSQFQYANIPGILSNLAAHQLVAMCMKNGSTASVAQYGGLSGTGRMMLGGSPVACGGSIILIRPGTDFALPIGIAPGSMGNIQIQFTLTYINQSRRDAQFVITTTSLSAGFVVLDNGAGRMTQVGLNSSSLMKAQLTWDKSVVDKIERGGFLGTLAAMGTRMLGRAAVRVARGALHGAVRGVVGDEDDESGGATAGAGMKRGAGAGPGGGQKRSRGSLFAALAGQH